MEYLFFNTRGVLGGSDISSRLHRFSNDQSSMFYCINV